jgi:hypothetical protein
MVEKLLSHFFLLIWLSLCLSSCLTLTQSQSGRTLDEGNMELHGTLSFGQEHPSEGVGVSTIFPVGNFGVNLGVHKRFDIGLAANYTGFVVASTKFQFLGNQDSQFAMSLGFTGGLNAPTLVLDRIGAYYTVPLYMSYHPIEGLFFYLTPNFYEMQGVNYSIESNDDLDPEEFNQRAFGYSAGVCVGTKNKFFLDISRFDSTLDQPHNFSIGYRRLLKYGKYKDD